MTSWKPISTAPTDNTPVDLWCQGERLCNYRRLEMGVGNVFWEPIDSGPSHVRDASHWMELPLSPEGE